MSVKQNIIQIGFDKNNEVDFGISAMVQGLSFDQMQKLRAMIPVAIGTMENMWRRRENDAIGNAKEQRRV